ncbi:MAG: acyl-CoA dehydrogenase, partial [Frankiaceae bacterium]|nr:acyl-CoA dehydrogenase [Frankiaceae bacterium]
MDFALTERGQDYLTRVRTFIDEEIRPVEEPYLRELHALEDRWVVLPIVEELKAKAKEQGLWNLFLPDPQYGPGLTN